MSGDPKEKQRRESFNHKQPSLHEGIQSGSSNLTGPTKSASVPRQKYLPSENATVSPTWSEKTMQQMTRGCIDPQKKKKGNRILHGRWGISGATNDTWRHQQISLTGSQSVGH